MNSDKKFEICNFKTLELAADQSLAANSMKVLEFQQSKIYTFKEIYLKGYQRCYRGYHEITSSTSYGI